MEDESRLVNLAKTQLDQIDGIVDKALIWPKRAIRWLIVGVTALLLGAAFLGYLYIGQVNLTHSVQEQSQTIQQGSISSCKYGNTRAATDTQNWDYVFGILTKADKKPSDLAEVKVIESHIAKADTIRDCNAVYGK